MKILAIEKPTANLVNTFPESSLKKEAEEIYKLLETDILREIYFTREENRAVLILECQDENTAAAILQQLPLVKENLIEFDIYSLKSYSGFKRLFKD